MSTPGSRNTPELLHDTAQRAARYLGGLAERSVAPSAAAIDDLASFETRLQREPLDAARVLDELDRIGSPATMAIAGPRFFGFVNGGALPASVAAHWLTTAWEQHAGFHVTSPSCTRLERIALAWVLELLGLPPACAGAFVTGTTTAHITALAAARYEVLRLAGWNVEADGLFGAPPITVVAGEEAHPTLFKALGVLGLGRTRVLRVPADGQGRMRADAVPAIGGPAIVCLQAGNVNTGASDPFAEIIPRLRSAGHPVWIHVDGAFGLWARVAPARAHLVRGVEGADSWATDGHKWLNCPYDCGIAIVRDGEALRRSMAIYADYLPPAAGTAQPNLADYTLELARRPRGVDAWAALRALGRDGLSDMVERHCRMARRFADAFAAAGFEVLNDVVLNQLLVSFGDDGRTRRVIEAIQRDGTCWCGVTVWRGRTAMRVSVISWATTDADIERSIAAIERCARATP